MKIAIGVLSTHKNTIASINILKTFGMNIKEDIYFFSDRSIDINNYLCLTNDDSYNSCVAKNVLGFIYFYENLLNKYDWFMCIDDDTYLNINNLNQSINIFDSNTNICIGNIIACWPQDRMLQYPSGGAGYIISRRSLETIIKDLKYYRDINYIINNYPQIRFSDVFIGKILNDNKITLINDNLFSGENWKNLKLNKNNISYHYVKKNDMLEIHNELNGQL